MRQGVRIDALKLPKKLTVRSMFYMGVGDSCQGSPPYLCDPRTTRSPQDSIPPCILPSRIAQSYQPTLLQHCQARWITIRLTVEDVGYV